jgi:DNA polymerase III delta prime subunit
MSLKNYIWYEKYRPKSLADMVLKREYRELFEKYIEEQEIPHLLLYGSNGSGKTTLAFILMQEIPCATLILNASSEDRGIATIKGKVKQFAASETVDGRLKVVFLDEGDKLTKDAQDALRNMMETYSNRCRFIITGNYIDKFQEAIKSRCTLFQFSSFHKKRLVRQLDNILKTENISYEEDELLKIIDQHYPDIRSVMNLVQASSISGKLIAGGNLGSQLDGSDILALIKKGDVKGLRTNLLNVVEFAWVYKYLFDVLLASELGEEEKKAAVTILSEYMWRDSSVLIREINFVSCAMELMGVLGCKKISF